MTLKKFCYCAKCCKYIQDNNSFFVYAQSLWEKMAVCWFHEVS